MCFTFWFHKCRSGFGVTTSGLANKFNIDFNRGWLVPDPLCTDYFISGCPDYILTTFRLCRFDCISLVGKWCKTFSHSLDCSIWLLKFFNKRTSRQVNLKFLIEALWHAFSHFLNCPSKRRRNTCYMYMLFEPTCASCTVGSYASLSVCLWQKLILHDQS